MSRTVRIGPPSPRLHVVPEHLTEVRDRKLELLAKTEAAVKERLTKEISYWDHRAEQLKAQEQAGKANARLNSGEARKRADLLQGRLEKRMAELKLERQIAALPPAALGGLLVVPAGVIAQMTGRPLPASVTPAAIPIWIGQSLLVRCQIADVLGNQCAALPTGRVRPFQASWRWRMES